MPSRIPDSTKTMVIQMWLQGEQRDRIAALSGLSAGAVTNIVLDWKQGLGLASAEELRVLATTLKKVGINAVQCATGFRITTMMNRLGIGEDNFESFMSDILIHCDKLGLMPNRIASFLSDLLQFSEDVPLSKLSDYIESKAQEDRILNQNIEKLKEQKDDLEAQKSIAERRRNIALEDEKMAYTDLKWYTNLKEELRRLQIPVEDISYLAKIVNGIKQYGYDVEKIKEVFADLNFLPYAIEARKEEVASLDRQLNNMKHEYSSIQQKILIYTQLEILGFGIDKLRLLHDVITEIAASNDITPDQAITKFFGDIEKNYYNNLNFESKANNLQADVRRLNQEQVILRSELIELERVGPSLTRLLQKGVTEKDIVDIAELLDSAGSNGSVPIAKIRSLVSDLREYGSLKLTLGQLRQEADSLTNQIASLNAEKRDLETKNQRMLAYFSYLREIVSFLSGYSVSLKDEYTWLASLIGYMLCFLNLGVEQQKKLQDSDLGGFKPLLQHTNFEDMSLADLRALTAKVSAILLGKLDSDNDGNNDNNNANIKQSLLKVLDELTNN